MVLFHVQHLLGAGHLFRIAAIARRLSALGVDTHVASGGRPVPGVDWRGVSLHQLPAASCAAGDFTTLLDEHGAAVTPEWCEHRRERLLEVVAAVVPRVAVIESFPFARRQLRFETLPMLERLRDSGCQLVCSIRDILQPKSKPSRYDEVIALLNGHFHCVLVHGDPSVVRLRDSFPAAARIACEQRYTGYVATVRDAVDSTDGDDEIVVSAGGGAVGAELLDTALQARRQGCQANRRWRFLMGSSSRAWPSFAPADGADVIFEPARTDFPQLLTRCALSVSQAGYNTMTDVLAASCRSLVVPYAGAGELEQSLRARRLQALGLVRLIHESALDAGVFASTVDQLLAEPAPAASCIDLRGAEASAAYLAQLLEQPV